MKTWKSNLEETKQRYINWWNHKGIILNMWEHFQEGVQPHAEIMPSGCEYPTGSRFSSCHFRRSV